MEKFDTSEGKWRTVGGRRIFIRDGESLSSAMKKSGKFKSNKRKQEEHYAGEELYNDDPNRFDNKLKEYNDKMSKEQEESAKRVNERYEKELIEKYNEIPQEERVKAYEEGKNWKDLVEEKERWNDEKYKDVYSKMSKEDQNKIDSLEEDMRKNPISRNINEKQAQAQEIYEKAAKEERLTKSGERDKRTITKKEMEEDFNKKVKQDPELSRQTEQARAELKARDEKARVLYQKGEIEKASGLEVKNAWETDLYGNGREHRFELSDGRIVSHTLESFGQEDDTWSIGKGSDRKSYKSYSDMMKDLGSSKSSSNTPYKKAFEEYKKKHPNSKLTLNKFIDMSEGK